MPSCCFFDESTRVNEHTHTFQKIKWKTMSMLKVGVCAMKMNTGTLQLYLYLFILGDYYNFNPSLVCMIRFTISSVQLFLPLKLLIPATMIRSALCLSASDLAFV